MAKKKQFLVLENEIDFILIGIVSNEKDYRLCFDLNKLLEINLLKGDDLELKSKNQESSFFTVSSYANEDGNKMIVISNKSGGKFLVSELKQWDYFFMIKSFIRETEKLKIIERIKTSKHIALSAEISPEKVKAIENLIF